MARFFVIPAILSALVLGAVFVYGGVAAFLTVSMLTVLEVTLSFDNAVVNAKVLRQMSEVWRHRFLTWGILIAVVGTRLILPILIVSLTALASPILVAKLAFFDGAEYGALIARARYAIDAFGGGFLAMLSLRYFLDGAKTVHWLHSIESRLSKIGEVEALEIIIVLLLVVSAAFLVDPSVRGTILLAGVVGIVLSVAIEAIMRFSSRTGGGAARGIGLFVYLNILDSAFSLDGVVGAFALTRAITLIVIGLGIGAYFVRALTVYLTQNRTLESLAFIEHGAYWAIFGLALSMFASLLTDVPEIVTGSIGLAFMLASYYSSVRARTHSR